MSIHDFYDWEWQEWDEREEDLDDEDRSLTRLHAELQAFEDAQVFLTEYDEEDDD